MNEPNYFNESVFEALIQRMEELLGKREEKYCRRYAC